MFAGWQSEVAAEFDEAPIEGGEFQGFTGEAVLEHGGAGTGGIGGEFGEDVVVIDLGAGGGGDGERFGEQFFRPGPVEGFA